MNQELTLEQLEAIIHEAFPTRADLEQGKVDVRIAADRKDWPVAIVASSASKQVQAELTGLKVELAECLDRLSALSSRIASLEERLTGTDQVLAAR